MRNDRDVRADLVPASSRSHDRTRYAVGCNLRSGGVGCAERIEPAFYAHAPS